MPVARPESSDSRLIAHIDLDCFYVQVEQRKQPDLRGLPTAVVQYNEWKGGALIAVSYEARRLGVSRHMRGDEAKKVCPQIHLVQVPVARGKADLNTYRSAGSEVVSILARKGRCERASIDEVYLDLTDSAGAMLRETPPGSLEEIHEEALRSHVLGLKNENEDEAKENVSKWLRRIDASHQDKLLACGALIVAELRIQVLKETQFTCSAGIAHNKMLAKLASGMNKPAQQTLVPSSSVRGLLESLPIKKMKQLGGKLGTSLQTDLGANTVGDLLQFSVEKLQERHGINTGTWLWNIARGIDGEEVQGRLLPKSHGTGKSFPGPRALKTIASVQHWLNQLCDELNERILFDLDQNKRIAHSLTVHASAYRSSDSDSHKKFPSKSCPLRYGTAKIQEDAFNLFQAGLREYMGSFGIRTSAHHHHGWGITALSVSASKIAAIPSGTGAITKYFHGQWTSPSSSKETLNSFVKEAKQLSTFDTERYLEPEPKDQLQLENNVPCLAQEQKRTTWKDQGTGAITKYFHGQWTLPSSSKETLNSFVKEAKQLSTFDTERYLEPEPKDQLQLENNVPCLAQEQKRTTWKDQGTGAITKYFHGQWTLPSSSKETLNSFVKEAKQLSTFDTERYLEPEPKDQLQLENNVPCLAHEPKRTTWKDQDSSCSSTVRSHDSFGKGASPSSGCWHVNQSNSQGDLSKDDLRIVSTIPTSERQKRKTDISIDKGTILKFLKSYNLSCPMSKQENVELVKGSQSPTGNCSEGKRVELPSQSHAGCSSSDSHSYVAGQNAQREAWNYKIDEIDQSIVDELPSEIQEEIRAWLQVRKQSSLSTHPSVVKRGSIAHYFLPTKST